MMHVVVNFHGGGVNPGLESVKGVGQIGEVIGAGQAGGGNSDGGGGGLLQDVATGGGCGGEGGESEGVSFNEVLIRLRADYS